MSSRGDWVCPRGLQPSKPLDSHNIFSWCILTVAPMTCFLMRAIRLHMYGHCEPVCVCWEDRKAGTRTALLVQCVRFFIFLNIYSVPALKFPSTCINHSYKTMCVSRPNTLVREWNKYWTDCHYIWDIYSRSIEDELYWVIPTFPRVQPWG